VLVVAGALAVPIAAIVTGVIVRRTLRRRTQARRGAAAAAALVPDVVELVLVGIHAGLTPAQAVLGLRPYITPSLVAVVDEIERRIGTGETLADALGAFTEIGGRAFQPFVGALALAERTGDPLGPVLDRLADEARRDRRRLADASARELPVRLSVPLVCCTLPAFLLLTIAPVLAGALTSLRAATP
jgi:tight adherence protein C